jgi:RNA:NAD 2'-phosphotransferase (TPT1/KptA family)
LIREIPAIIMGYMGIDSSEIGEILSRSFSTKMHTSPRNFRVQSDSSGFANLRDNRAYTEFGISAIRGKLKTGFKMWNVGSSHR